MENECKTKNKLKKKIFEWKSDIALESNLVRLVGIRNDVEMNEKIEIHSIELGLGIAIDLIELCNDTQ